MAGRNKSMSVKWRQSTGEMRVRHVNNMAPPSPRINHQNFGLSDVPETSVSMRDCSKTNNIEISTSNNNDLFKTTPLITVTKTSDASEELKITSITFVPSPNSNCSNDTLYKTNGNTAPPSNNNASVNSEYS